MTDTERQLRPVRNDLARGLQGTRAGFPTRVTADFIDIGLIAVAYVAMLVGLGIARYLVDGKSLSIPSPSPAVTLAVTWTIAGLYFFGAYVGTGRTVGKQLMGVRVVNTKGRRVRPLPALVRVLIVLYLGVPSMLWILISRKNAALHDIAARTAVLYDWTHD